MLQTKLAGRPSSLAASSVCELGFRETVYTWYPREEGYCDHNRDIFYRPTTVLAINAIAIGQYHGNSSWSVIYLLYGDKPTTNYYIYQQTPWSVIYLATGLEWRLNFFFLSRNSV